MLARALDGVVAPQAQPAQQAQRRRPSSSRDGGKWELEVHGGGMFGAGAGGTAVLPAAGANFTTISGTASRRVASWFFGDGTDLFNSLTPSARGDKTITTLNAALGMGATSRNGEALGARIGYDITPRLTAEFSFDFVFKGATVDDDVLTAVEASRASFVDAWTSTVKSFGTPVVTAEATIHRGETRQITTVGVVLFKLTTGQRLTPFLTGGMGLLNSIGDDASVALTGTYAFPFLNTWPFAEQDNVTLRFETGKHDVVAVAGGGFTYAANDWSGLRVDVRALIGGYSARTTLDSQPVIATLTPASALAVVSSPSIQLSNNPSVSAASSLSPGMALTGFETYQGSGTKTTLSLSAGWYWRF